MNPDSASYGTILHTLDLGTKGNETHHWGYTDDRTKIWAGGLFSSRIWILDVASDPAKGIALLKQCKIPIVREFIARRLATTSLKLTASK